jgi:hypothetical protein
MPVYLDQDTFKLMFNNCDSARTYSIKGSSAIDISVAVVHCLVAIVRRVHTAFPLSRNVYVGDNGIMVYNNGSWSMRSLSSVIHTLFKFAANEMADATAQYSAMRLTRDVAMTTKELLKEYRSRPDWYVTQGEPLMIKHLASVMPANPPETSTETSTGGSTLSSASRLAEEIPELSRIKDPNAPPVKSVTRDDIELVCKFGLEPLLTGEKFAELVSSNDFMKEYYKLVDANEAEIYVDQSSITSQVRDMLVLVVKNERTTPANRSVYLDGGQCMVHVGDNVWEVWTLDETIMKLLKRAADTLEEIVGCSSIDEKIAHMAGDARKDYNKKVALYNKDDVLRAKLSKFLSTQRPALKKKAPAAQ